MATTTEHLAATVLQRCDELATFSEEDGRLTRRFANTPRPRLRSVIQALAEGVTEAGRLLRAIVAARLAFLVVGGTGSGKTTLLAALLGCVPAGERIVCVEEAPELVAEEHDAP